MKPHEIFAAVDPAVVKEMLDWFRENDKNVYKSALATLAGKRKMRPVFLQKKSIAEQYAWIQKTLQVKAFDDVGEQILQAYLLSAQQSMLAMFCNGLGIIHDGKGVVVGELPKKLDKERLDATVEQLVDIFDPKMLAVYFHCFNVQMPEGYPELTEILAKDERLKLG